MDEGMISVRYARSSIELEIGIGTEEHVEIPKSFNRRSGVFVTLNTHPGNELRGCIGFPEPVMPLKDAIREAAISAATRDPRFQKVKADEMDSMVIDVTILTPPRKIDYDSVKDLISSVKIGRDGLIARKGFRSGLLLPQVPLEWKWGVEEFLSHTCMKAGMHPDEWKKGNVEFQNFSGRVFGEEEPRGKVIEKELS